MKRKLGIIGLGFLGGSMDRYFTEKGEKVYRYDRNGTGSEAEVNEADIVFVCVNTPFDTKTGSTDLSYVESAVATLKDGKVIVLRSTIPVGTTDMFQKRFPEHRFMFVPEFLRATTAYQDFIKPQRQVVGTTKESEPFGGEVLDLLPSAPAQYSKIVPARAAELLKYGANTLLASRVAIANKLFDFAKALGIQYEDIKDLIGADQRIGNYGLEIMQEGFRGYNGTCFPKDVRSLIAIGDKLGVDTAWLKNMDDENIHLLRTQGLEPNYGYPQSPENNQSSS